MELKELKTRSGIEQNKKLVNAFEQFNKLLSELRKKELSQEVVNAINEGIDSINSISESGKELRKQIRSVQSTILKLIARKHKIVTKNYYRNTWLAIGMAAFGVPLGVALGSSLGNMGFIGIGIPLGMVIGMAVGTNMDKKALEEGKQLDVEIKF